MSAVAARYREFRPSESLRPYVRALFTFCAPVRGNAPPDRAPTREILRREGEAYWSSLFADSEPSIVFCSGNGYRIEGLWNPSATSSQAHVIGPMSGFRHTSPGHCLVQTGAYIRAGHSHLFFRVPAVDLSGCVVALNQLWGTESVRLECRLSEAISEANRVALLEGALIARLQESSVNKYPLNLPGLAAAVRACGGRTTVESMAHLTGVSRQYLGRAFHEGFGISPKLFLRLTRFRVALEMAGRTRCIDWADLAVQAGYSDQAHLIAEFREFSGMTPGKFEREHTFHPFTSG